jgi:hypothetical protein
VDSHSIDLVTGFPTIAPKKARKVPKSSDGRTYQAIYASPSDFFSVHPPEARVNFYLVGDAHIPKDSENRSATSPEGVFAEAPEEFVDVHWNAIVVDKDRGRIVWYDPALEGADFGSGDGRYDFDAGKRGEILKVLQAMTPGLGLPFVTVEGKAFFNPYCGGQRAQQICETGEGIMSTDVFCQSWVCFFVDAYAHGAAKAFIALPYARYQNAMLKAWLLCVLTQLPEYETEVKMYRNLLYCRRAVAPSSTARTEVWDVESVPIKRRRGCALDVIDAYAGLKE